MKLPAGERAIVEIAKLRDYCLNPGHARGRHKARVFASALGLTAADAEYLKTELLKAARTGNAVRGERDSYGQRFLIDFEIVRGVSRATIRSAWIILATEEAPRLTSCFVQLA
jgi:hypothetical protein